MTATLCPIIPQEFSSAGDYEKFFSKREKDLIAKKFKPRENIISRNPAESCRTNLFFGFFFDGTKNNYRDAEKSKTHSNVARLYDCYPGLSVPGVLPTYTDWPNSVNYSHFFKTYIPGVSSAFDRVKDTGKGLDETRGGAAGYMGEARILWALLQAINNVHRYVLGTPMLSSTDEESLLTTVGLNQTFRRVMTEEGFAIFRRTNKNDKKTREAFEKILARLHKAVSQHWPDKATGRPKKVAPAMVQQIYISTFGFSRGATQARAFTNWLMSLCKLDATLCGRPGLMTLGGFEVKFDFLGLFDTVASIGAGNTLGNSFLGKMFDGHGAWADTEDSLRVPEGLKCLHLVAAHELRRSFPLDSISVKGVLNAGCDEVVVPGVHSDLGCGYAPGEQGRGTDPDGEDMLTRVPLLLMYRAARLAGVPLRLEEATAIAKRRFKIAPSTITAINGYLAACATKQGTLTDIMREQADYQMQWHLARRIKSKLPLEATHSFQRASTFDQNDLHSANLEFEYEITKFEEWLKEKGAGFKPTKQDPGFKNEHPNEWMQIARWWRQLPTLKPEMLTFFDNYVHDSRAWFKLIPGNPDSESKMMAQLKEWEDKRVNMIKSNAERKKRIDAQNKTPSTDLDAPNEVYFPLPDGLTQSQRAAAQEYGRTQKIPRMQTYGREPFEATRTTYYLSACAGYLRYRKIYGGWDSVLLSSTEPKSVGVEAVA